MPPRTTCWPGRCSATARGPRRTPPVRSLRHRGRCQPERCRCRWSADGHHGRGAGPAPAAARPGAGPRRLTRAGPAPLGMPARRRDDPRRCRRAADRRPRALLGRGRARRHRLVRTLRRGGDHPTADPRRRRPMARRGRRRLGATRSGTDHPRGRLAGPPRPAPGPAHGAAALPGGRGLAARPGGAGAPDSAAGGLRRPRFDAGRGGGGHWARPGRRRSGPAPRGPAGHGRSVGPPDPEGTGQLPPGGRGVRPPGRRRHSKGRDRPGARRRRRARRRAPGRRDGGALAAGRRARGRRRLADRGARRGGTLRSRLPGGGHRVPVNDERPGPVLALVGPTAAGKTALALELAPALDAEIISADAMLVYRGMDIHAVVDEFVFPPTEEAVRRRLEAEAEVVGLPALYRRLVDRDPEAAARVAPANLRRIVRALEVMELTGRRFSSFRGAMDAPVSRYRLLVLGLDPGQELLRARVAERVAAM